MPRDGTTGEPTETSPSDPPPSDAGHEEPRSEGFFERRRHPWLVAIALAGAGWWLIGLVLGLVAPGASAGVGWLIHLLGLATVLLSGAAYGILWWADYVQAALGW